MLYFNWNSTSRSPFKHLPHAYKCRTSLWCLNISSTSTIIQLSFTCLLLLLPLELHTCLNLRFNLHTMAVVKLSILFVSLFLLCLNVSATAVLPARTRSKANGSTSLSSKLPTTTRAWYRCKSCVPGWCDRYKFWFAPAMKCYVMFRVHSIRYCVVMDRWNSNVDNCKERTDHHCSCDVHVIGNVVWEVWNLLECSWGESIVSI